MTAVDLATVRTTILRTSSHPTSHERRGRTSESEGDRSRGREREKSESESARGSYNHRHATMMISLVLLGVKWSSITAL